MGGLVVRCLRSRDQPSRVEVDRSLGCRQVSVNKLCFKGFASLFKRLWQVSFFFVILVFFFFFFSLCFRRRVYKKVKRREDRASLVWVNRDEVNMATEVSRKECRRSVSSNIVKRIRKEWCKRKRVAQWMDREEKMIQGGNISINNERNNRAVLVTGPAY